jgi:hypothetical protein
MGGLNLQRSNKYKQKFEFYILIYINNILILKKIFQHNKDLKTC